MYYIHSQGRGPITDATENSQAERRNDFQPGACIRFARLQIFSTDPEVHGSQNPLLYRELDCIQYVIWPADAILDRFTGLHPEACSLANQVPLSTEIYASKDQTCS